MTLWMVLFIRTFLVWIQNMITLQRFAGVMILHKYKNSDVRGSADGDVDLLEDFDSSKWEVIGNIFDNPELLESEE